MNPHAFSKNNNIVNSFLEKFLLLQYLAIVNPQSDKKKFKKKKHRKNACKYIQFLSISLYYSEAESEEAEEELSEDSDASGDSGVVRPRRRSKRSKKWSHLPKRKSKRNRQRGRRTRYNYDSESEESDVAEEETGILIMIMIMMTTVTMIIISICIVPCAREYKALLPIIPVSGKLSLSFCFF